MKSYKSGPILAVGLWFFVSVSLSSWWLIFSLDQLKRIRVEDSTIARQQQMLILEGGFLFLLLLVGALGLLYYIFLERKTIQALATIFCSLYPRCEDFSFQFPTAGRKSTKIFGLPESRNLFKRAQASRTR